MPSASISPARLTTLSVMSETPASRMKYIRTKVPTTEIGMATAISAVVRKRRRNR